MYLGIENLRDLLVTFVFSFQFFRNMFGVTIFHFSFLLERLGNCIHSLEQNNVLFIYF